MHRVTAYEWFDDGVGPRWFPIGRDLKGCLADGAKNYLDALARVLHFK